MTEDDQRFVRLYSAFRDNQEGTSMTEFLIILPIYILIFVGINNLSKLESESVIVKLNASKQMWNGVLGLTNIVQLDPSHAQPMLAGAAVTANVSAHPSGFTTVDIAEGAMSVGLMQNGSWGESQRRAQVSGAAGLSLPTTHDSPESLGMDDAARDLAYDRTANPLPAGEGALSVWIPAMIASIPVPRAASGAGSRYGIVVRDASVTVTISTGQSFEMSAGYEVLVPPAPRTAFEEFITVGHSRLGVEKYDCFKEVLGIDFDQPLTGC
jgi:hypothetical protein